MSTVEMYEKMVVSVLKTIYDPEIPVNIYDLGLIYKIDVDDNYNLNIDMTLTAPNCPMADDLMEMVNFKLNSIEGVGTVKVNLVFEPAWDKSMLSEEAKLDLGFL
ncbi:MAG TPA: iron-sulfur cluster assembly protein [Bacteroidales bacterium]|nr:iron-sulfur cluster assembly protein [Bacteroidales bacterium]HQL70556.1 iron-sulfur cluster assembly protein [Bacteroidales bacterium]